MPKKKKKRGARKAPRKAPKKATKKAPRKAPKKATKKARASSSASAGSKLRKMHGAIIRSIEHVRKSDRKVIADLRRALDHADATAKSR